MITMLGTPRRCCDGLTRRETLKAGAPTGERAVVRLGDAVNDRQAKADPCVVGAYALGAALKRLRERGHQLRGELLTGVLDGEHHGLGVNARGDPHGAIFRQVVDDRVVDEVRRHLQQERV